MSIKNTRLQYVLALVCKREFGTLRLYRIYKRCREHMADWSDPQVLAPLLDARHKCRARQLVEGAGHRCPWNHCLRCESTQ